MWAAGETRQVKEPHDCLLGQSADGYSAVQSMPLPGWLLRLRRAEVVDLATQDPRTSADRLLGVARDRIFTEVIGGGQADFDAAWEHLSPADRALLYAFFNQLGHLEELHEAFRMLFTDSEIADPVVVDLGCGPFTGGLALASVLGGQAKFTYIGQDRAASMRHFGEKLAKAAISAGELAKIERQWVARLEEVEWAEPPGWRPVVVIVSYLFASPTVDADALVRDLEAFLSRVGRGPATILYTNSPRPGANRNFPTFRAALECVGFKVVADDTGRVQVDRYSGPQDRELRYALLHRQSQGTLKL